MPSPLPALDRPRWRLDPTLPLPLHYQVAHALRHDVVSGALPPGALVPAEVGLAQELGVSRQTVRQAIAALVQEGLLERHRGRGTYVATPRIEQDLSRFYTFAHEMERLDLPQTTSVLSLNLLEPADPDVIVATNGLQCEPTDALIRLVRLRFVAGSPFLIETSILPVILCPTLARADTGQALARGSLYAALRQCGWPATRARETIRPVALEVEQARLLQAELGSPSFQVDRITMSGERRIEWRRSIVRGDRASYTVELRTGDLREAPPAAADQSKVIAHHE